MAKTEKKTIRIEYYRSKNSTPQAQGGGEGSRFHAAQPDCRARGYGIIRGMVKAVPHLVRILES